MVRSCCLRYNDFDKELFTSVIKIYTMEVRKLDKGLEINEKNRWGHLFSMKNEEELQKVRSSNDMMANIVTKMVEFSETEKERCLAYLQDKYEHDKALREKIAAEEVFKQGKEQGIEQGIELGTKGASLNIAKKLKEANASVEMIMKVTGLTIEEIKAL